MRQAGPEVYRSTRNQLDVRWSEIYNVNPVFLFRGILSMNYQ